MPTTEKIKTTMAKTTVRFPRAPTEWPMILISVFKVGQDLANLKTLSCKKIIIIIIFKKNNKQKWKKSQLGQIPPVQL